MDEVEIANITKPQFLIGTVIGLSVCFFIGRLVWRLYFDPLSHIPGPWINSISRIPYATHLVKGTTVDNVLQLHQQYGEVVRISPNEVSFISGETAWQDIYGFRTGKFKGQPNLLKDPDWYPKSLNGFSHILVSSDQDHSRYRRTFSHAFSDKALANQEPILQKYVDFFVSQLRHETSKDRTQDLAKWYNWTTFDIIADLIFGEPFGCLRDVETHRFVGLLLKSLHAWQVSYIMSYYPGAAWLRSLIFNKSVVRGRVEYFKWTLDRTQKRIESETERQDFMTEILKHNGEKGAEITLQEMGNNATVLLAAGSETTASLLSAATYCLLSNPSTMKKLKNEVRGLWKKYDDITLSAVNKAPYLIAILQEALRYLPPVPTGFGRRVGKEGAVISGHYIPEGAGVYVSQIAQGRSERYFRDAESFIPERWLDDADARFANDKRDALQPFSFGPRNCLGRNLAYAESRLILAKIIWSFDLELDARSKEWFKQGLVRTVWVRPPLWVHVKEAVHDETNEL